jgi:DNA repair ATPase RecN
MLSEVVVRDFQSLRRVELALGKFTVVMGPSNVGKTAVLRAIRMVAQNVFVPKVVVAHGAKAAQATLLFEDGKVSARRGPLVSIYSLNGDAYPKSGRNEVPGDVADFLRFVEVEGETLNFAFQHDLPFLLDAPSVTVAKVLGDLTNVNRLLDAVREAARRRREAQAVLKVRRGDVESLKEKAQEFRGIPAQQKAVAAAREAYQRVAEVQARHDRAAALIAVVEAADQALDALEAVAVPVLELDLLDDEVTRTMRLVTLIRTVVDTSADESEAQTDIEAIENQLASLDAEYHDTLKGAGQCPVCGAKIK